MTISFADPVEREIWQTVRDMNAAWTQGNPEKLDRYFHRDMIAITATDRNRLEGGAACLTGWKIFCDNARIHWWKEIDPLIRVYGDAAVVAYYFEMSFDMNGQTIALGGRDMFFMVKEDGHWQAVGDQFSGYPS